VKLVRFIALAGQRTFQVSHKHPVIPDFRPLIELAL